MVATIKCNRGYPCLTTDAYTDFNGDVTADSEPPCPDFLFNDEKQCDVRLNESDTTADTQCEGYTELYPLLMFGPDDAIIKEYTTPTLRTLVTDKGTDVFVFLAPGSKALQAGARQDQAPIALRVCLCT